MWRIATFSYYVLACSRVASTSHSILIPTQEPWQNNDSRFSTLLVSSAQDQSSRFVSCLAFWCTRLHETLGWQDHFPLSRYKLFRTVTRTTFYNILDHQDVQSPTYVRHTWELCGMLDAAHAMRTIIVIVHFPMQPRFNCSSYEGRTFPLPFFSILIG